MDDKPIELQEPRAAEKQVDPRISLAEAIEEEIKLCREISKEYQGVNSTISRHHNMTAQSLGRILERWEQTSTFELRKVDGRGTVVRIKIK